MQIMQEYLIKEILNKRNMNITEFTPKPNALSA